MGTSVIHALQAHIVSDLLVRAAITDLRAGTVGTLAALNTQIYASIALITFLTIGGAVNQVFAIRTPVCCKYCQLGCRNYPDHHYQR